jgi:hypothetical protein
VTPDHRSGRSVPFRPLIWAWPKDPPHRLEERNHLEGTPSARGSQLVPMLLERDAHELTSSADAGLLEQLLERGLHRALRGPQPRGDLLLASPSNTPRRTARSRPLKPAFRDSLGPLRREDGPEITLIDPGCPADDGPDCLGEETRGILLEEDSRSSFGQELPRLARVEPAVTMRTRPVKPDGARPMKSVARLKPISKSSRTRDVPSVGVEIG